MGTYKYALLDVRLLLFILTIGILVVIIVPTYVSYSTSQGFENVIEKTYEEYNVTLPDTYGDFPGNFTDDNGVEHTSATARFVFVLSGIDPIAGTAKIILALGAPLDGPGYFSDFSNATYTYFFEDQVKSVNASNFISEWTFPLNIFGDPGRYPFDSYTYNTTFIFSPTENFTNGIPIQILAAGFQTGWQVQYDIHYSNNVFHISPIITRNLATKGFSLFVVVLSWILSLCQFFIAIQSVFRNRPIIPTLLAVPATLLFALPSLRGAQPGIPPIGIFLDIAGFYWNMALVAISLIAGCLLFIFQFEV
ncbi:unnamed protein product [Cunninghamella echinulata]